MNIDKKIIIALIAVVVIVLAGVIAISPNSQDKNQTAYEIPLKTQAFNFFDIATPIDSNFVKKSNQSEDTRGMVAWQNKGNFTQDVDLIIISKNYTDRVIPDKMKMISNNNSQKIYLSKNYDGNYYRIVKTINDTDIIVSGHNLDLLEKMLNTTKVKDTSGITLQKTVVEKAPANNTTKNTTTVKKTPANNTSVEKKEEKTPVQQIVEKRVEEKKQQDNAPKVETTTEKTVSPLMIGGGSFTTGSADEDKTYARIYVGVDHAGKDVGVKIFYSRDGTALNNGNYVTATVKSDGFINIASADAYSKYPDFAKVELYDANENLVATQGIHLNPTSGTQYF